MIFQILGIGSYIAFIFLTIKLMNNENINIVNEGINYPNRVHLLH